MTLAEIQKAITENKEVRWMNDGYKVYQDSIGQYLITFIDNDYTIGLTHQNDLTLNGNEQDFYIKKG
jgi:hypothetical protein|tara:strand:+ start:1600 stop:1800 length:201 start_codon:yes stop_codon:yes gene_type:complete